MYDERFLLHCTGPDHPESPRRLEAIYRGIKEAGLLPKLTLIRPVPAKMKWIEAVHSPKHIVRLEEASLLELGEFDHPDNQMCKNTFDTAVLAAGGVLEAVRLVMEGALDNAFCAVRPPGHHAEMNRALGFCFFNNIAIAGRYLQKEWAVKRIGIVDFDAHHGNGTQRVFDDDPTVFYYSIHEHPSFSFPGTGRDFERGSGAGTGFTLNSPVLPGSGDREYRDAISRGLLPAFESFKPEVILVSAGFDAHADDDMSDIRLTAEGFSWITRTIVEMAAKYSGGRLISVLEGGYCVRQLPGLVGNHIKILLGL